MKIRGKENDYLRYADNTTLMAEIKEELKSLFIKMKEENEKAGWKINISKIMASDSHHFSSVQFSCSVVSNSLQPHGMQQARFSCLSLSARVCLNSCSLSRWCYLSTSSFAALFFCLQPFPASESFRMSRLFASGGQSIGASASVLPMNIEGWFPLGLTGLSSLLSKGLSRLSSSTAVGKHQFFSIPYDSTNLRYLK